MCDAGCGMCEVVCARVTRVCVCVCVCHMSFVCVCVSHVLCVCVCVTRVCVTTPDG